MPSAIYSIDDTVTDLISEASLVRGKTYTIQNQSEYRLHYTESATAPTALESSMLIEPYDAPRMIIPTDTSINIYVRYAPGLEGEIGIIEAET